MQGGTQLVVDDRGTTLPAIEILTGRGFITGKSGSGKSNTANVIVEELLTAGHPLLIVDTDGEYWGLKDTFEILHIGSGDRCDVHVDDVEAGAVVEVALGGFPVIYDISEILSGEKSTELLADLVAELFRQQKREKEPLLLVVEEVHEYIPEQGSTGDVGDKLIQIAKRGRKHGLGFCGISQRPAAVDKDFITQCDWIMWHKLTWDNDTDVVSRILGSDEADAIQEFDPGEVFLLTDWDDRVKQTRIKKKRSYDAGATPGFQESNPPPLIDVPSEIVERFAIPPKTLREAREEEAREQAEEEPASESADDPTDASSAGGTHTIAPSDEGNGESPADDESPADGDEEPYTHLSEVDDGETDSGGSTAEADRGGSSSDGDQAADSNDPGRPSTDDRDQRGSTNGRDQRSPTNDRDRRGPATDRGRRGPTSDRDDGSPASERDRRGPGEDRGGAGRTTRRARNEHRALSPHPVGNTAIDFVQELAIMLHYFLRRFVASVAAGLRRARAGIGGAARSSLSTDGGDRASHGHPGDTSRASSGSIGPVDVRQAVPILVIVVAVVLGVAVVLSH